MKAKKYGVCLEGNKNILKFTVFWMYNFVNIKLLNCTLYMGELYGM